MQLKNMLHLSSRRGVAFQRAATDIIDSIYDYSTIRKLGCFLQEEPYRGKCTETVNQPDSSNQNKLFPTVGIILCYGPEN